MVNRETTSIQTVTWQKLLFKSDYIGMILIFKSKHFKKNTEGFHIYLLVGSNIPNYYLMMAKKVKLRK